jgi:lysophospholipase
MLATPDGVNLRVAFWNARLSEGEQARGTVFVLQGRAEFMEKFNEVFEDVLSRGYAIATLDWRGQGGSSRLLGNRRKGHVEDFTDYLIDLDCLVDEAHRRGMPEPFTIIAHSMGGAITLLALARGPSAFARAVLSAPLVKIHGLKSLWATTLFAQTLSSIGFSSAYVPFGNGRSIMEKPFEGNPLTRDPTRYERSQIRLRACQHLALGDATVGWVDAALHALKSMQKDDFGDANRTPILMLLAGADTIVDTPAAEELAQRMRGASAIVIPGARHEILMEIDDARGEFWRAFDAFAARATVQTTEPLAAPIPQEAPIEPVPHAV